MVLPVFGHTLLGGSGGMLPQEIFESIGAFPCILGHLLTNFMGFENDMSCNKEVSEIQKFSEVY